MGEVMSLVGSSTLISIFLMMIASPRKFFTKVDTFVLNEPDPDIVVEVVNPLAILPPEDNEHEIDEERIKKFDQVILNAKGTEAKKLWIIKREQYLRRMRWRRYIVTGKASERY